MDLETIDFAVSKGLVLSITTLDRDDIARLHDAGPSRATTGAAGGYVKHMRASHRRIARLVASGLQFTQISERTGYTVSHISNLCNHSTAFAELVDHYIERLDNVVFDDEVDLMREIKSTAMDSLDALRDELIQDADMRDQGQESRLSPDFKLRAVKETLGLVLSRSPSRMDHHIYPHATGADIATIKADQALREAQREAQSVEFAKLAERSYGPVIEATCEERPALSQRDKAN
jgi:hypothetical protein